MDSSAATASIKPRCLSFADLPYDIRAIIWTFCLPHRVYEMDQFCDEGMWDTVQSNLHARDLKGQWNRRPPCGLERTSYLNARPPLITRVCQEAREIAFRARNRAQEGQCSPDVHFLFKRQALEQRWMDCSSDRPHIYYDSLYNIWTYGGELADNPLSELAEFISVFACKTGSLMIGHLLKETGLPETPDRPNMQDEPILEAPSIDSPLGPTINSDCEALELHYQWQVVMGLVVVHSSTSDGAGFFGLLGDAPIQIVDATERERIATLTDLAEECERRTGTTFKQDFTCSRTSVDLLRRRLDHSLFVNGYPKHLYERLRPAIMFRLCTHACHVHDVTGSSSSSSVSCSSACNLDQCEPARS